MWACLKALKTAALCLTIAVLPIHSVFTSYTKSLCQDNSLRISNVGEKGTISADLSTNQANFENPCVLRIEACSACQIEIMPAPAVDFEFTCRTHLLQNSYCSLGCDYLHIFDMYYMNETRTSKYYQKWSDFSQPFKSESSNIFIMLCHGYSGRYNFSLNYQTVKKQTKVSGTFTDLYQNKGTISSPFFPRGYYLNHEVYEYTITGLQELDRIMVIFDDWHLDPSSAIYYDDGQSVGSFTGGSLRPSLVTDSNQLRFMFHTGQALSPTYGRKYMGFKATYSFHSRNTIIHKPVTSCKNSGTFFNKVGGHIEFEHTEVQRQLYDCVWVVKKKEGYSGIYLKITALKMIGYGKSGYIVIRDGLTSDSKVVGNVSVHDNLKTVMPFRQSEGFYIRMTGVLSSSDTLQMAYASYIETPVCHRDPGTFECEGSRRCIASSLTCDGYDHCGDNSDEDKACGVFTPPWDQSYQYTITIGVIVPMVISVFLVMVICLLFVVIRRCRRQRREQARSPDRIRTLSEDVSPTRGNRRRRRHRRRMFNASADRDNPPTYDEAIQSPPSWYLNVGFSTPVDPNSPQPPPYSEAVDNQTGPGINNTPGSPASSHSSQSEVTIDSRRHSVSSSSSEGGFREWNTNESDGEGRRGRIGRHVSSSDDSDDDEQMRMRARERPRVDVTNDVVQTGSSQTGSEIRRMEGDRRKGKADNKPNGDLSEGKEKSVKDKNKDIPNVVESNIDEGHKAGAEIKQGTDSERSRNSERSGNDQRNAIQPSSPDRLNTSPSRAGLRSDEGRHNTARPQLSTQRGISRSDGNLAQNRGGNSNRALDQGTRFSLASHALPEEDFTQNLVVDVDTNEVRVVYNGADDNDRHLPSRDGRNEATNRASPRRNNLQHEHRGRSNLHRLSNGATEQNINPNDRNRIPDNRNDRISGVASAKVLSSRSDVHRRPDGQNVGRAVSVNYIPLFIDGNPEEDIYV